MEDGKDGGGGSVDPAAEPEAEVVADDLPPEGGAPDGGEPKPSMFDAVKAALGSGDAATEKPAQADAPPAKPAAEKAPVKPEEKYQVPRELSQQGQTRFKELVSEIKSKDEAIGALNARVRDADGFLEVARGVGAGAVELGQFFEFMGHLKNKPENAIRYLEAQIKAIAQEHGLAAGGNEEALLARHPDLVEDVNTYRATRERALETAQLREQGKRRETVDTQTRQEQERALGAQEVEAAAIKAVVAWTEGINKSDIDWQRKKAVLFEQLPMIVDGVSPDRWLAKIQSAYKLMGPIKAPAPQPSEIRPAPGFNRDRGSASRVDVRGHQGRT
jgi:hypothetical protein